MALSIFTLAPNELGRFLIRHRRGETIERYDPRIDHFFCDILKKANEFVPSAAGAILLDDPKAKLFGRSNTLTIVGAFGQKTESLLGYRLPCERGLPGHVYTSGKSTSCRLEPKSEESYYLDLEKHTGLQIRSLLGVPVLLGSSICGVLQLINRADDKDFTLDDITLIEIFAGYISSSIQNTLDGMRARELARRDDLTGLFNDRYFHIRLREEITRADREKSPLSLIFLDLDHFKHINDRYGHLEGSRILHEMGMLLTHEEPVGSVAARYGGDEFVLILPGLNLEQTMDVAERLRLTIHATHFDQPINSGANEEELERPHISASFGVASLHEQVPPQGTYAQRANTLIRLADGAMYQAKLAGKNRVLAATPEK